MDLAQSNFVNLAGLRLHYVDWGGSGTPILLVHGLASTTHIWDLVAQRLRVAGHVIALDLRGHGLSDQPATGYDFATITQDMMDFTTALDLATPLTLIGHSWGGYAALYWAAHFPTMLSRIVLVDGGVVDLKAAWPTWKEAEQRMTPPDRSGSTAADIRRVIQEEWLGPVWTPEIGELAFQTYQVNDKGLVQPRLAKTNHMQIAKAIWQLTPADHFASVSAPTLIVQAIPPGMAQTPDAWEQERQRQVRQAAQQIPNARVAWLDETIHDIPWQRPARLAELIIDFCRGV